jgi:hypothetical protein
MASPTATRAKRRRGHGGEEEEDAEVMVSVVVREDPEFVRNQPQPIVFRKEQHHEDPVLLVAPVPRRVATALLDYYQDPQAGWARFKDLRDALKEEPKSLGGGRYRQFKLSKSWCIQHIKHNPHIIPNCLRMRTTEQGATIINAFVNWETSQCQAHYDSHDRLLFLQSGLLQVYMAFPTDLQLIDKSCHYNSNPFKDRGDPETGPAWRPMITLAPGDCLYIPAEWVRAIRSAKETVVYAIKVWKVA